MKKFIGAVAMLVVMSGAAAAQGGGGGGGGGGMAQMTPEQRVTMTVDRMFKDITLTDAQKAKATEIIKKAMEATAGMDRQAADFREKMTAANTARNTELKALLTNDADKAKFDANAAQGGGRGRPPVL